MRRLAIALTATALALGITASTVSAEAPPPSTFVVVLDAASEVPPCAPATNAARGVAIFRVTDEATGTVQYRLVANNLPGATTAAHIHLGPPGVAGPVVQPLAFTPGNENGVIGAGEFTNLALLTAIRTTARNYYVNVHTSAATGGCPSGVIRGQFGDRGPQ